MADKVGYPGSNTELAKKLVQDATRGQKTQVKNQKKQVKRQTKQDKQDAKDLYKRAVGDLNHIYGAGAQDVNQSAARTQAGYTNAVNQIGGRAASIAPEYRGTAEAAQGDMARKGSSFGFGGELSSNAVATARMSQQYAQQSAVNSQNTLAMMQGAANQASQMLLQSMQGSKTSELGKQLNLKNTALTDINRNKRDELSKLNDAMREIKATEPGLFRQMLLDLDAQGFDQWQAIQQLNLSREQFAHAKAQDAARLALDRQNASHRRAMDMAGMQEKSAYYGTNRELYGGQVSNYAINGYDPAKDGYPAGGTRQEKAAWQAWYDNHYAQEQRRRESGTAPGQLR